MKKLLVIALLVSASFQSFAGVDDRGVIYLEPDAEQEPAPDPALQDLDVDSFCLDIQRMSNLVSKQRDLGARESDLVKIVADSGRQDLIWVVKQAYFPVNISRSPDRVAFEAWLECKRLNK